MAWAVIKIDKIPLIMGRLLRKVDLELLDPTEMLNVGNIVWCEVRACGAFIGSFWEESAIVQSGLVGDQVNEEKVPGLN